MNRDNMLTFYQTIKDSVELVQQNVYVKKYDEMIDKIKSILPEYTGSLVKSNKFIIIIDDKDEVIRNDEIITRVRNDLDAENLIFVKHTNEAKCYLFLKKEYTHSEIKDFFNQFFTSKIKISVYKNKGC